MKPPSRLYYTQKESIVHMHDWIWDLPTLHIDLVKSVFKIEQVVACGKQERLSR